MIYPANLQCTLRPAPLLRTAAFAVLCGELTVLAGMLDLSEQDQLDAAKAVQDARESAVTEAEGRVKARLGGLKLSELVVSATAAKISERKITNAMDGGQKALVNLLLTQIKHDIEAEITRMLDGPGAKPGPNPQPPLSRVAMAGGRDGFFMEAYTALLVEREHSLERDHVRSQAFKSPLRPSRRTSVFIPFKNTRDTLPREAPTAPLFLISQTWSIS